MYGLRVSSHAAAAAIWLVGTILVCAPPAAAAPPQEAARRQRQADRDQVQPPPQPPALHEKVTVTATRLPESAALVGSAVTVLTGEELRASGAQWLMQVLEGVAGVTVARTGGPGAATTAFLRGANSNHTLVLVDGVKVDSPTTGAFDLSSLPVSQIERIEILRGPQSVLYGSDAIGGVIQVITRRPSAGTAVTAGVQAGAYDTVQATAGLTGTSGALRYAAGVEVFDSDGISAADARRGNVEPDGFRNTAFDARVGYRLDDRVGWDALDVEAFATYTDGRVQFDGFDFVVGPTDDALAVQERRELLLGGRARARRGIWEGTLTASLTDERLDVSDPNGFATASRIDGSIAELDWQNDLRFDPDNTLVAGVEFRREAATSTSISPFGASGYDQAVSTLGVYAQHRLTHGDRLHLSAGARYENHGQFGARATWRLTGAWSAIERVRLHGSVATGFRAPTFDQLYFPGFGNPALAPETSRGWDLGATAALADGRVELDLTWFRNDLDELIEFTFPAGFVNLGQVVSRGLEARASWRTSARLRLAGTYTFTDASARGSDEQLLRRPRHQGSFTAQWQPRPRLAVFAALRYKGARNDFGAIAPVVLSSYARLDVAAQWSLTDAVELVGRIDNLTNTLYEEVWGFGTPGRSAYAGVAMSWPRR